MPKIELTETELHIKLTPAEKIWALHGDITLRAAHIRGVEVADNKEIWKTLGLRLPGTGIPTYVAYGSFWRAGSAGGWTFSAWMSTKPAIVLNLSTAKSPHKEVRNRYKRVLINVDDAQKWADAINDAITGC